MQGIASINKFRLRRARRSLKADFYEKNFLSHCDSPKKLFLLHEHKADAIKFFNVLPNSQNNRSKPVDKIDNQN